ncbi:MAG: wax ester/triacylglycerol synthase family O-acyltransferase [Baekduia sp.]
MPQQHLDRLTALDASFIAQESAETHMHIGGLVICEGPPPEHERFLDHVRSRLHLVPRYRQRIVQPPMESGRWLWADDPSFNLDYHVRRTALPSPGDEQALLALAGRIASQQLDRQKPLWEMWVIEGLEDDRFALISKTHHALIDGIAGVDLATVMFDIDPVPANYDHPGKPWRAQPEPTSSDLLAGSAISAAKAAAGIAGNLLGAATRPSAAWSAASETAAGVGEMVAAALNPAPATPLNQPIGPHRRFAVVRADLEEVKFVKNTFGGTVNDVVLALVTSSLRHWLHRRGVQTEGLELRALVPVSTRPQDKRGQVGNAVVAMRGPVPVYIEDPVHRLRHVHEAMDHLKASKQAVGAEVLVNVQGFTPPTVLAQASRLNFSTRLFNLIVTNVPGPQVPLYVVGRQMQDVFPIAFLPRNHGLAVGIMSYNGQMNFGLLADYDVVADVDEIAFGIREALDELVGLARERQAEPLPA